MSTRIVIKAMLFVLSGAALVLSLLGCGVVPRDLATGRPLVDSRLRQACSDYTDGEIEALIIGTEEVQRREFVRDVILSEFLGSCDNSFDVRSCTACAILIVDRVYR